MGGRKRERAKLQLDKTVVTSHGAAAKLTPIAWSAPNPASAKREAGLLEFAAGLQNSDAGAAVEVSRGVQLDGAPNQPLLRIMQTLLRSVPTRPVYLVSDSDPEICTVIGANSRG